MVPQYYALASTDKIVGNRQVQKLGHTHHLIFVLPFGTTIIPQN
nr:MAG TPA: hypothetical protein [Caudoviricetes sp.]